MEKYESKDPLTSVLYSLLRDHIQPGNLEQIVMDLEKMESGETTVFSNGYLAQYAEDIAERIRRSKNKNYAEYVSNKIKNNVKLNKCINDIDWDDVYETFKARGWTWYNAESDVDYIPTPLDLKNKAKELLDSCKRGSSHSSCGRIHVVKKDFGYHIFIGHG